MYAVEKWIVDRSRTVHVLLVYTGDPEHRITLSQYTPRTPQDYDKAVHVLRRDGARPKQTQHGVLMVTSLAHFRSDYTIVKIPDGDFGAVKDQLYANINLLRMGCSGRSALSLDEPSDPTKDRFLSAYQLHLPQNMNKDRLAFTNTVLEFVKLIQAGLALFACYGSLSPPPPSLVLDGLLCDDAVEGIHRWIAEVGEPWLGLEPTERVADPSFVSGLLSTVISSRNKLHALVTSPLHIPIRLQPGPIIIPATLFHPSNTAPVPSAFLATQMAPFVVTGFAPPLPAKPPSSPLPTAAVLNKEVLEYIDSCYDKSKSPDNRRVRRVFKGKLDDLTRGSAVDSDGDDHDTRKVTLSDSEASQHPHHLHVTPSNSVGTSTGNRVLGGITTFLSPHSGPGGTGSITDPITSLSSFLSIALSKEAGTNNFSSGGRIRRIRDSVGGAAASSDHSVRMAVGKGVSKAMGKAKRQRESVDMGHFYTGGALAGAAGLANPMFPSPLPIAEIPPQTGGVTLEKELTEKEGVKEKEVVVGGSVKALWAGRIADLVKVRETCEEVAKRHQLHSSALIVPSSLYPLGPGGSTGGSHHSGHHVKDKGKKKEKLTDKLDREKEKAKEKLKAAPSALLGIHSDTDHVKSDTGRSTEGEESDPIYASPSRSSGRPTLRPHSNSFSHSHTRSPNPDQPPQPPHMFGNPMASASFGSLLGGRVRGKLGNWTGLTKRKGGSQSVDLSASGSVGVNTRIGHGGTGSVSVSSSTQASPTTRHEMPADDDLLDNLLTARPVAQQRGRTAPNLNTPVNRVSTSERAGRLSISVSPSGNNALNMSQSSNKSGVGATSPRIAATPGRMTRQSTAGSQPQSPTLPPMIYSSQAKSEGEEEDVFEGEALSSGQVSPLSDYRSTAFISRSRPPLPRHFSLTLPSSQTQDRNYLSVATVNEKLSRLSTDQRGGDSSARSSRTNLNTPFYSSRQKLFLYPTNANPSNVHTGDEDEGASGSGQGGRRLQGPPKRPTLGYRGSGRSSTTVMPRISSWSDPLSAAFIKGVPGHVTPLEHIEPLDLGGMSDPDERELPIAHSLSSASKGRGDSIGAPTEELSDGDVFGDSYVAKPPSLAARPSIRARRRTEQGQIPGASWVADDDGGVKKERARFHSLLSVVDRDGNHISEEPTWEAQSSLRDGGDLDWDDGEFPYVYDRASIGFGGVEDDADDDVLVEGGVDIEDADWVLRRRRRVAARNAGRWADLKRRRSFSDLDDWWGVDVLSPERQRVDVEMCGQVLVMIRREEHLRNVIGCLEVNDLPLLLFCPPADVSSSTIQLLNSSLSQTNTLLRQEYDSHLTALSQLSHRTKVLADIDLQSTRTDNLSQQTNVLRYEAEQFHVPSLYHAASLSRQKVLELRHKVFGVHGVFPDPASAGQGSSDSKGRQKPSQHKKGGTGSGRILPEGVRGAHGKFNRLQKRLDGTEVVVDWLGRTESEVEEEESLGELALSPGIS
ncbi:hypothetical protein NMY22_g5826 [Coprinellus aureogranulatus]|nr:hypothetical protein NMY22_g5826 [Coprinellus aureogranulatus]